MAALNSEITGIRLFKDCDGRGGFSKLAILDITVPGLAGEIRGALLTWSKAKGWKLAPPPIKKSPIWWNFEAPWATEMAKHARAAYFGIGGEDPEIHPTRLSARDHEVIGEALDKALAHARRQHDEANIEIDEDGLHRTLRVDLAVEEACNDAGL